MGKLLSIFFPSRDIRQGDPLSPYIFILCMKFLSLSIEVSHRNKTWNAIRASRGGLVFTYTFFADDLLFLLKPLWKKVWSSNLLWMSFVSCLV